MTNEDRFAAIGRAVVRLIATPNTEDLALEFATVEEVVEYLKPIVRKSREEPSE